MLLSNGVRVLVEVDDKEWDILEGDSAGESETKEDWVVLIGLLQLVVALCELVEVGVVVLDINALGDGVSVGEEVMLTVFIGVVLFDAPSDKVGVFVIVLPTVPVLVSVAWLEELELVDGVTEDDTEVVPEFSSDSVCCALRESVLVPDQDDIGVKLVVKEWVAVAEADDESVPVLEVVAESLLFAVGLPDVETTEDTLRVFDIDLELDRHIVVDCDELLLLEAVGVPCIDWDGEGL